MCFVCVWKLSAGPSSVAILPWNTYFILAEEEAERILRHESPHTAGHTHTHASHWERGAHTHRGTRKDAELVLFFCRGGPGCCGASGTGAVVHPHRWKSRLGLTGLQHGPAHTRLARCARAQVPLSFKVTATATARGHLCRFDKANVRDGHIFGN